MKREIVIGAHGCVIPLTDIHAIVRFLAVAMQLSAMPSAFIARSVADVLAWVTMVGVFVVLLDDWHRRRKRSP